MQSSVPAHSKRADALWPSALRNPKRWVTQYFVHLERIMAKGTEDTTLNEGVAGRFVLQVANVDPERMALLDPRKATHEGIKPLGLIFEDWVCSAIGAEKATECTRRYNNPRLYDFLVVDEGSLAELAGELPDYTRPAHFVGIGERQARMVHFDGSYVWLVDSRVIKQLCGDEDLGD